MRVTQYIVKRLLSTIPVLLVVSVFVFLLVHLAPGDPAITILGPDATVEQIEQLRVELGLDAPLYQQYVSWMSGVLKGDMGESVFAKRPVLDLILQHLGPSFSLAVLSLAVAILIAVPLGILAARKRGSLADQMFMSLSVLGISVPHFVLGLLLISLFTVRLGWLPIGYKPPSSGLLVHLQYLLMPAITLGVGLAALIARMTRASMIETLSMHFIKTAKAKGLRERAVVYKHALRHAFIPVLTVIGQSFGLVLSGALVAETIFNIPGMGQLIFNSMQRRDFLVIQGLILFVTFLYVLINLIVDLLYCVIDPRVRLDRK